MTHPQARQAGLVVCELCGYDLADTSPCRECRVAAGEVEPEVRETNLVNKEDLETVSSTAEPAAVQEGASPTNAGSEEEAADESQDTFFTRSGSSPPSGPATRLHEAGYEDLVSVIPPRANISKKSSIRQDQTGKIPGKKGSGGWYGYAFTEEVVAPTKIDAWGANVGLLGNRFPALDIDSEWPDLTKAVLAFAAQRLGLAPVRLSRDPRRLLVYRAQEPFSRMALRVSHEEQTHTIEWLGQGRQYLVAGDHPSGAEYRWNHESEHGHLAGELWTIPPEELYYVDQTGALDFLKDLAEALEGRGLECEIVGDGRVKEEISPPQEELLAPSIDALRDVVSMIPNTNETFPERDDYIRMGHAVKAAGAEWPDEASEVFSNWCDQWEGNNSNPEGNHPGVVASDWARMHPPYRIGWSWLQEQATNLSDYVSAVHEFEADPDISLPRQDPVPTIDDEILELSDVWVIKNVLGMIDTRVRYVAVSKDWHVWNGYAWELDQTNAATSLVRLALFKLSTRLGRRTRALDWTDSKQRKLGGKLLRAVEALQGQSKLETVMKALTSVQPIASRTTDFDSDPWLLNTPGGVIDLETGERLESDPALMLSKSTAVTPEPGEPIRWLRFLNEATDGDVELQRYLQKFVGYALTGDASEQILSFVWGRSNTGKSVFVKTIAGMLGTYAEPAPLDTFIASRSDRIPADLASLVGARLVHCVETQAGRAWDEQRIKAITAGDAMKVRHLYGRFFSFEPTFKILIAGNHEPAIRNLDDAMKRRVHVVPLNKVVPIDERDRQLPQRLEREWPQILSWAIEGCLLWRKEGLEPPEAVQARTEQYHAEEDEIGQWIAESVVFSEKARVSTENLYMNYRGWTTTRGGKPLTQKMFTRDLNKRDLGPSVVHKRMRDGERLYYGFEGLALRIQLEADDAVAAFDAQTGGPS